MGTAHIQGKLWGSRAKDWAGIQEHTAVPLYRAVLEKTGVCGKSRVLDVGCGAGTFCSLAAALGASALVRAGHGRPTASARAVAGLSLSSAFVWLVWRLRPREGYGVRVDIAGAELSRAIDGRTERVLWPQIKAVDQVGRWAPRWVLSLTDGTRRELPRALFSDPSVFADLGRVLNRPQGSPRADA